MAVSIRELTWTHLKLRKRKTYLGSIKYVDNFTLVGCNVLNYAPGPVHTAMIEDVIKDKDVNHGVKEAFCSMIENKTILKPQQSAEKLVQILEENNFKSGDHIDYYD